MAATAVHDFGIHLDSVGLDEREVPDDVPLDVISIHDVGLHLNWVGMDGNKGPGYIAAVATIVYDANFHLDDVNADERGASTRVEIGTPTSRPPRTFGNDEGTIPKPTNSDIKSK